MSKIPHKILPEDKVCWNCDNFVRDYDDFKGHCILKEKRRRDNDTDACRNFVELYRERCQ